MKRERKLVAFYMDGTLLEGSLIRALAEKFGFAPRLAEIQADRDVPGYRRTGRISSLLRGLGETDIIGAIGGMRMV